MSKGGVLDVYLDDEHIGKYDCYSKTATSEKSLSLNVYQKAHTHLKQYLEVLRVVLIIRNLNHVCTLGQKSRQY